MDSYNKISYIREAISLENSEMSSGNVCLRDSGKTRGKIHKCSERLGKIERERLSSVVNPLGDKVRSFSQSLSFANKTLIFQEV